MWTAHEQEIPSIAKRCDEHGPVEEMCLKWKERKKEEVGSNTIIYARTGLFWSKSKPATTSIHNTQSMIWLTGHMTCVAKALVII